MGAFGSHEETLREEEIEELVEISGLEPNHIVKLFERFRALDTDSNGYLTRSELLRLPELSMNSLRNRVLSQFKLLQKDNINFTEFVTAIAPFGQKATLDQKIRNFFQVFDENDDGFISEEELTKTLLTLGGSHLDSEEVKKMAKKIIAEYDQDLDGKLNFNEFKKSLKKLDLQDELTIGPWRDH